MKTAREITERILRERGIVSQEDISEFLSDRPQRTYDPFLLLNMEAGVDLLLSEAEAGHRICIYGDYDADGVTSICVLSRILSMLTDNFTYYIPSRFDEGYGLNMDAIAEIRRAGTDLLVTVDCGSVSYDEVEYAKALGMKVIVTDHHNVEDVNSDCILINPKQPGCGYPFKELAGCGVAFKMVQAICRRKGFPKSVINDVLDMTAIGTVGDIVSLIDENRTIVKYGLDRINKGRRKSLKMLTEAISLKTVTSESIAFGIAPHINAAGRMASAREAAELFLSDDSCLMEERVKRLVALNSKRKKAQEEAYSRCMEMVTGDERFIVLRTEDIHEGIAGIVAGKIKDTENRPVIIVTPSGEGCLKGTGRSIENVDIFALLKKHDELFLRFGGHRSACGFLMKEENLPQLRRVLDEEIRSLEEADPYFMERDISWEAELAPAEVTVELARELERLQPFGKDNPRPLFMMDGVILQQVRFMGEGETHAAFKAVDADGRMAECILFRKAQEEKEALTSGRSVDLVGTVSLKEWMGRESAQFIVEEIM